MVAGIIFSFIAAVVINSGNVIEKHAVSNLPEISARRGVHLAKTLLGSKLWMVGFILCLVGLALQIMAFALAPIPVVQSIFNAGIVLLLVLSRVRLGEKLSRTEWVGLGVVVVSVVLMSASLSNASDAVGLGGSGSRVLIAVAPTLLVVGVIVYAIRSGRGAMGFFYGAAAGLLYGAATLGTKGASTLLVRHGVAASIPDILQSAYPYVFVAASVLGMVVYQTGLQRFRISVVGAMSDVVNSTYLVVIGTIVFDEHLPRDPVTLTLRLVGFVGVLAGSVLVALGGHDSPSVPMPPVESDLGLGPVLVHHVAPNDPRGKEASHHG